MIVLQGDHVRVDETGILFTSIQFYGIVRMGDVGGLTCTAGSKYTGRAIENKTHGLGLVCLDDFQHNGQWRQGESKGFGGNDHR